MDAILFDVWASQYIGWYDGRCDFSFAIRSPQLAEGTIDGDTSVTRSVKFDDKVEIRTVPRYADILDNIGDLFYSGVDVARFKNEFKIERIQQQQWRERLLALGI